MKTAPAGAWSRGFSLVEVMVSVIVIAVGMLGIAKMHALALASTGAARMRSIAALEAASLASAMHTNRTYWAAAGVPPATINITGNTISDATLGAAMDCTSNSGRPRPICTSVQLAAYDLQTWASSLTALLPNDTAAITCSNTSNIPVTCTIQIAWVENAVGVNAQEANQAANAGPAAFQKPTYTLYVEP
jgi:type IV pilus assembly protein PilV